LELDKELSILRNNKNPKIFNKEIISKCITLLDTYNLIVSHYLNVHFSIQKNNNEVFTRVSWKNMPKKLEEIENNCLSSL